MNKRTYGVYINETSVCTTIGSNTCICNRDMGQPVKLFSKVLYVLDQMRKQYKLSYKKLPQTLKKILKFH